ncbi:hypothetical protein ACWGNW_13205, partial [Heyndrickxia sporothermodurans]
RASDCRTRWMISTGPRDAKSAITPGPLTEDEASIRRCFRGLKELQNKVQALQLEYAPCNELSMGMSNDYTIAIEEGATFVRIGTSLVG